MGVMLLGLTITCLLFPALTVPFSLLGYISKNKVQRVLGLFFLALFMGLMAMCFRDPKTDPDIVRYIAAVKDYANVSFFRAFNHGSYENLYVIDIWFWIIAKTGNYQLIAGTSVFFTYLISLYVLQDYAHSKSFNLRQRVYTLFLLMGLMNFCFSVNALRSELAFAMILLAVYRELYQKRRSVWTYFLYVLPIFMHFAAILLVLIRFIVSTKKRYVKIILMMLLLAPLVVETLVGIVDMLLSQLAVISYTQAFLKRTLMYFNWDTGGWATVVKDSGYYLLNKVFSYSVLVMMALAFWNIKRSKKGIVFTSYETDLIRSADHAKMCDRQSSFLMSDNPLQIYEKPMKNPPAPSPREKSYVIIYGRMRFWRSGFRNGTYRTGSRGIYKKGTMYAQRRQDKINDRTGTV